MKLVVRFALTAVAVTAAVMLLSCSTQGPTSPAQNNQPLERGIGGYYPPPYDPTGPEVIPCDVTLGGPAGDVLNNVVPFKLSCENMASARMFISNVDRNRRGCPSRIKGSVMFWDSQHSYSFEMFLNTTGPDCAVNGGWLMVSSPYLGDERVLFLPAPMTLSSRSSMTAN